MRLALIVLPVCLNFAPAEAATPTATVVAQLTELQATVPAWLEVCRLLDVVNAERSCFSPAPGWYTDLGEVEAVARATGMPIMSLRLHGSAVNEHQDADLHLYRMQCSVDEHVVESWHGGVPPASPPTSLSLSPLCWAPTMTLDFGDGRKLRSSLTGHGARFVLEQNGQSVEAWSGSYTPASVAARQEVAEQAAVALRDLSTADPGSPSLRYQHEQTGLTDADPDEQADDLEEPSTTEFGDVVPRLIAAGSSGTKLSHMKELLQGPVLTTLVRHDKPIVPIKPSDVRLVLANQVCYKRRVDMLTDVRVPLETPLEPPVASQIWEPLNREVDEFQRNPPREGGVARWGPISKPRPEFQIWPFWLSSRDRNAKADEQAAADWNTITKCDRPGEQLSGIYVSSLEPPRAIMCSVWQDGGEMSCYLPSLDESVNRSESRLPLASACKDYLLHRRLYRWAHETRDCWTCGANPFYLTRENTWLLEELCLIPHAEPQLNLAADYWPVPARDDTFNDDDDGRFLPGWLNWVGVYNGRVSADAALHLTDEAGVDYDYNPWHAYHL